MIELFDTVAKMTEDELYNYLAKEVRKFDYSEVLQHKKFLAVKGDIPILLITHLDTVFYDITRHDMLICHDKEQGIFWSPDGLGADDRAGITLILYLLQRTNLRPHLLFTKGEESGAAGAIAAMRKAKKFFDKICYIIELDRQGLDECVFYSCKNFQFQQYIIDYGFVLDYGTFTDISIICPAWNIAGVNLSVGYYGEHSYQEMLFIHGWAKTYSKLIKMLETVDKNKVWKYKEK